MREVTIIQCEIVSLYALKIVPKIALLIEAIKEVLYRSLISKYQLYVVTLNKSAKADFPYDRRKKEIMNNFLLFSEISKK